MSAIHSRSLTDHALNGLLALATVLTGLMAGFFYAYACSVMIGLARTDDATFINTMQWINATVRNAAFGPAFFGALVVTVAAAISALSRRDPAKAYFAAAAVLYAAAFVITFAISVPLNNELAAAGPVAQMSDPAAVRDTYERPWMVWNIIRTGFATAALASLACGLLRGRSQRPPAGVSRTNAPLAESVPATRS